MTREQYEDAYRIAWQKQAKLDKEINPTLRLSQKPARPVGGSKESGARGGKANRPRPYVSAS
jgi:hypothetical protein